MFTQRRSETNETEFVFYPRCFASNDHPPLEGPNLAERNLGGLREKPVNIFEIFLPEFAANASNFKNYLIYMGNSSIVTFFSPFLHNYRGAVPPGPSPSYGTEYYTGLILTWNVYKLAIKII